MRVRRYVGIPVHAPSGRRLRTASGSRSRVRSSKTATALRIAAFPSKSRHWWTRLRSFFYSRSMRRVFVALIALAFLCVSSTPPAAAMPVQASEHQAHCADMPAPDASHHKAPAKSMDGQKCCFAAIPPAAFGNRIAAKFTDARGDVQLPKLAPVGVPGGNWAADPPPPRLA